MNWIRINITVENGASVPDNFSEDIANLLIISGVDTFTNDDFSDLEKILSQGGIFYDYIDDSLLELTEKAPVVHAFLSPDSEGEKIYKTVYKALEVLKSSSEDYSCLVWDRDEVRDEDWENNWKEFFKPFPVGERLFVKPTWEALPDEAKSRLVIEIDPASSFGTGAHATTKLCLEKLEEVGVEGAKVLDMGCGSGILSIGALLLGGDSVVAVDIDESAARIAKENLELNGFPSEKAEVYCGNVLEDKELARKIGTGYDVICANIVASIIVEMAPLFHSCLKNGARLIASGILSERENEVKSALEKAGFSVIESKEEEDWLVILAEKN